MVFFVRPAMLEGTVWEANVSERGEVGGQGDVRTQRPR